ncbi:MAG: glycosyltransferase, partial [Coriobacteriales bacterium]|nr:glycosyltransferase [Coriobacteriales bacterium]
MKFVVSGGGTAGHVNPAIACARELIARGHEVLYVGTPNGPEARLAPAAGLEFMGVEAAGFNRNHPTTLFSSSAKIYRSSRKLKKVFTQLGVDAVVGFGGYVSLPVGMAANALRIPVVLHEQNSVPGLTNKLLAPKAKA